MMIEFDSHTLWVKVKKQEGIGKMKFSLIIGTLNRCRELEICLESLRKQVFRDFEVIIIDQSINDSTQQLANGYQDLNIIYEHVDFMGLSKARNYALKMAHGDYFALIDDDAYYDERYLWEADKVLNDDREMILVGNIVQKSMLKKYSSKKQLKAIGYHQIMKNCPSPVLVFPYTLYCKGICFDENFGVGATFGACEETDLILEALDNKYQIGYCENMFVVHPTMKHSFEIENTTEVKKRENYARGLGALLEKDKVIRKNKRLHYYEMEKKCKILLKKTGLFGKKEKDLAIADLRGLNTGKRDFRKLLEKETYR